MLSISVSYNIESGKFDFDIRGREKTYQKRSKGKSILMFPNNYVVIDVETTGLDPQYDELIEVSAIKVIEGYEIDRFSTLIKPNQEISDFITNLTGITNEMLIKAPPPEKVIPELRDFIGNDVLIAHNAHFDVNFIYDYMEAYLHETFGNDFVCTMRLARRLYPEFSNHRLSTICEELSIENPTHRAMQDAISAWEAYKLMRNQVESTLGFDDFEKKTSRAITSRNSLKASEITTENTLFDARHILYGRTCVFTGTLSKMVRRDAMHLVADFGGLCADNITRDTNYLIMGIQDYSKFADGEKSNKLKKAEKMICQGLDIEIISENVFYEMILDEA